MGKSRKKTNKKETLKFSENKFDFDEIKIECGYGSSMSEADGSKCGQIPFSVYEKLIDVLHQYIKNLLIQGSLLEMDMDGLKEKNEKLKAEMKCFKKKYQKQKKKKSKKRKRADSSDVPEVIDLDNTESPETNNVPISESDGWEGVTDFTKEVQAIASKVELSKYHYDESSKMYYDSSSGYWFDPHNNLFFDNKSGTYFYYDEAKQSYEFHSQIESADQLQDKDSIKSEVEPGEIVDEENERTEVYYGSPTRPVYEAYPATTAPSLRLVVEDGELAGQLFIVTIDGGIIGSEDCHSVPLESECISRRHAQISYKSDGIDDHHYFIQDLGSRNGTYVEGHRLSEAKQTSQLIEVGHGWKIQCGLVVLKCHVHPGSNTCNECEPGLLTDNTKKPSYTGPSESKETARKRQMRKIKKKVGLLKRPEAASDPTSTYTDRSAERRVKMGSDNPYEKTQMADVNEKIPSDNIGMKMMEKMGWTDGEGLGASKDGLTQPVAPATTSGRSGLGLGGFLAASRGKVCVQMKPTQNLKTMPTLVAFQPASDILAEEIGSVDETGDTVT